MPKSHKKKTPNPPAEAPAVDAAPEIVVGETPMTDPSLLLQQLDIVRRKEVERETRRRVAAAEMAESRWLIAQNVHLLADGVSRLDFNSHPFQKGIYRDPALDHDFFYFGGVYYDSGPSGYEVCAPPVDANIPELPPGTETIQVGDTVYYYAAGAFYVQQPDGTFVTVVAPLGVTVSLLPPDATSIVINGIGYFQADGVCYQPVMQNGVTAYLTVPQP